MRVAGIIVAGGRGTRFGGPPKQWRDLNGQSVAAHAAASLAQAGVSPIVFVHHPDDAVHAALIPGVTLTPGGATRADSVRAGLEALATHAPDAVLIHDAARPCLSLDLVTRVLNALSQSEAAAPAVAVTDALWRGASTVEGTQPRENLCAHRRLRASASPRSSPRTALIPAALSTMWRWRAPRA